MRLTRMLLGVFAAVLAGPALSAQAPVSEMDAHIAAAKTAAGLDYRATFVNLCLPGANPALANPAAGRAGGAGAAGERGAPGGGGRGAGATPDRATWYASPYKVFDNFRPRTRPRREPQHRSARRERAAARTCPAQRGRELPDRATLRRQSLLSAELIVGELCSGTSGPAAFLGRSRWWHATDVSPIRRRTASWTLEAKKPMTQHTICQDHVHDQARHRSRDAHGDGGRKSPVCPELTRCLRGVGRLTAVLSRGASRFVGCVSSSAIPVEPLSFKSPSLALGLSDRLQVRNSVTRRDTDMPYWQTIIDMWLGLTLLGRGSDTICGDLC